MEGPIAKVIEGQPELFRKELGKLKNVQGKLYVDQNFKPIFCKARPLPFTLLGPVDREIDRLISMDVQEVGLQNTTKKYTHPRT